MHKKFCPACDGRGWVWRLPVPHIYLSIQRDDVVPRPLPDGRYESMCDLCEGRGIILDTPTPPVLPSLLAVALRPSI